MTHRISLLASGLLLCAVIASGCATGSSDRPVASDSPGSQTAGDLAFQYRVQAAELSAMAERMEFEAEWHSRKSGQDSEQATHARDMAKELRAAAEQADQKSREYRNQLPHNQVY